MKRGGAAFIKAVLFGLAVIIAYAAYSNYGIPEIKTERSASEGRPPSSAAGLPATVDEMAALGEAVYNGKGACTLCHAAVGGRAPLLEAAASVAEKRISDPAYKGNAKTGEEYLRESMYDPSAYVVQGYGAVADGKLTSPMPDVRGPAIGLTDAEADAVIAYLQKLGGVEVTVRPGPAAAGVQDPPARGARP